MRFRSLNLMAGKEMGDFKPKQPITLMRGTGRAVEVRKAQATL